MWDKVGELPRPLDSTINLGSKTSYDTSVLFETVNEEDDILDKENGDPKDIKFAYRSFICSKSHASYLLKPTPSFDGFGGGKNAMPSYIHLFQKFWVHLTLWEICLETIWYVGSLDESGSPRSRDGWYPINEMEFKKLW